MLKTQSRAHQRLKYHPGRFRPEEEKDDKSVLRNSTRKELRLRPGNDIHLENVCSAGRPRRVSSIASPSQKRAGGIDLFTEHLESLLHDTKNQSLVNKSSSARFALESNENEPNDHRRLSMMSKSQRLVSASCRKIVAGTDDNASKDNQRSETFEDEYSSSSSVFRTTDGYTSSSRRQLNTQTSLSVYRREECALKSESSTGVEERSQKSLRQSERSDSSRGSSVENMLATTGNEELCDLCAALGFRAKSSWQVAFRYCVPWMIRKIMACSEKADQWEEDTSKVIRLSAGCAPAAVRLLDLRERHLQKLYSIFASADLDNSGIISFHEFLHLLGCVDTVFVRVFIDSIAFDWVDLDTEGYLNFSEFVLAIVCICALSRKELLFFLFRVFDDDKSGAIEQQEFRKLAQAVNDMGSMFPGNYSAFFSRFDANDDGTIDFKEFLEINDRFPMLFFPTQQLQDNMRHATFSSKIWQKLSFQFSMRHGGARFHAHLARVGNTITSLSRNFASTANSLEMQQKFGDRMGLVSPPDSPFQKSISPPVSTRQLGCVQSSSRSVRFPLVSESSLSSPSKQIAPARKLSFHHRAENRTMSS